MKISAVIFTVSLMGILLQIHRTAKTTSTETAFISTKPIAEKSKQLSTDDSNLPHIVMKQPDFPIASQFNETPYVNTHNESGGPRSEALPPPLNATIQPNALGEHDERQRFKHQLNQLSQTNSLEEIRALENEYNIPDAVVSFGTINGQANTQRVKHRPVSGNVDAKVKNRSLESNLSLANEPVFGDITQYHGTIDTWQVQNLKIGDHFSLPVNSTQ